MYTKSNTRCFSSMTTAENSRVSTLYGVGLYNDGLDGVAVVYFLVSCINSKDIKDMKTLIVGRI